MDEVQTSCPESERPHHSEKMPKEDPKLNNPMTNPSFSTPEAQIPTFVPKIDFEDAKTQLPIAPVTNQRPKHQKLNIKYKTKHLLLNSKPTRKRSEKFHKFQLPTRLEPIFIQLVSQI